MSHTIPEPSTIAALSASRPTRQVKAGAILFQSGDHGEVLVGVVSGTMELTWGGDLCAKASVPVAASVLEPCLTRRSVTSAVPGPSPTPIGPR